MSCFWQPRPFLKLTIKTRSLWTGGKWNFGECTSIQAVKRLMFALKPWSLRKVGCKKPRLTAMNTISNHCAVRSGSCMQDAWVWADCDWVSPKGEWLPSHQHQSRESISLTWETLLFKWMPECSSIFNYLQGLDGGRVERGNSALEKLKKPNTKIAASFHFT